MLRKINAGWIQIKAKDADIGATINCDHIVAIRMQPELKQFKVEGTDQIEERTTGRFMIFIDLVTGQSHGLTMDDYEEAAREYERLSDDLRGETVQ